MSYSSLCLSVSSECLGSQQTVLAQLCVSDQAVSGDVDLVSMLYWPLQQLHQYSRVLLKLAACYDVVRRKLSALFLLPFFFWLKHSQHVPSFPSVLHFLFSKCSLFPTIKYIAICFYSLLSFYWLEFKMLPILQYLSFDKDFTKIDWWHVA